MAAPASSAPSASVLTAWLDAARAGMWAPMADMMTKRTIAEVDVRDAAGVSALSICCEEGHADCVDELIKAGARVDQADDAGCTVLMHAAEAGSVDCMQLLFAAAAAHDETDLNINSQDSAGETAMLKAARAQELGAVRALIEYDDQKCDLELTNTAGDTALLVATAAASAANLDVLAYLLNNPRHVCKPNAHNRLTFVTPLLLALTEGKFEALKLITAAKGCDSNKPDRDGNTPIMRAIADDLPIQFLAHLLSCKPALELRNNKGYTAVHLAVRESHQAALELLLKHSPLAAQSVLDNEFGWTPLQHAAARGSKDLVKALCEAGVDVNVSDKRGSTPLLLASRFGHLACVKWLVKHKALLGGADQSGNAALMDATENGHAPIVAFLMEKGAADLASLLLAKTIRGNNALHKMAALAPGKLPASALDIAKMLLGSPQASQLLNAVNAEGETAWTLSRANNHAELSKLFAATAAQSAPEAPLLTSVVSGDASLTVTFKPAVNAAYMMADLTYELTATPVSAGADSAGDEVEIKKKTAAKKKSVASEEDEEKKSSAPKKAAPSASSSSSSSVKIAEPTKKGSIKKAAAGATAAGSKKASASASTASSSSGSAKREVVGAQANVQSTRGLLSPLRLSNLQNGLRYVVSLVACTPAGRSPPAKSAAEGVLVGTPAPPVITNVVTGSNWASVSFMPGGSVGATAAGATSSSNGSNSINPAAIQEFILTATVSTPNPRHSAPVASQLAGLSVTGGTVSSSMHRVVSAVSSPVLLTNLAPGLSYALSVRARNGYGEGAPTLQSKLVSVGGAASSVAVANGSSASSSSSSSSSLTPAGGDKHIQWLQSGLDQSELSECTQLLSSCLSAELQALHKGASSADLRVVRAAKILNHALQTAFTGAAAFMQAIGCSRTEAEREQWGYVALERGQSGLAQLALAATHGLLPLGHPLTAPAGAPAPTSAAGEEPSYNLNTYPVGSPFKGVYVSTHVSRRMLLEAAAAGGNGGAEQQGASVHRVLICKMLPGRTRVGAAAVAGSAATAATPAAAASAAVSAPSVQSTRFDSHQSPSGSQLFLYSPSQALPCYCVEFALALPSTHDAAADATPSEAERAMDRDADLQSGARAPSANDRAPLRADPLGEQRFKDLGKWMGAAPGGSGAAQAPGELSKADLHARDAAAMAGTGSTASSAPNSGRRRGDDDDDDEAREGKDAEDDEEERPRLDINKAQSSLLGPASKPKKTPAASTLAVSSASAATKPRK